MKHDLTFSTLRVVECLIIQTFYRLLIQVQAHFISHYLHKVNIEREVQLQQIVNPKYTTEPGLLIFGGRGRWESVHNREP